MNQCLCELIASPKSHPKPSVWNLPLLTSFSFIFSLMALSIHLLADSVFTSKMQSRQIGASGQNITKSTSISGEMYTLEKNDGSQSDTAVGTVGASGKKRRSSIGAKMVAIVGLSRKSRSTSQLSQTGRIKIPVSILLLCVNLKLIIYTFRGNLMYFRMFMIYENDSSAFL